MIDLGQHAAFILWAYLGVAIAVAALIAWTLFDAHQVSRKLAALEARKPRRSA
ncbi:MAG: heme exporter protein CcmD [Candidatus Devosia phytovorans]|uniref:Heme exporter protein D n=1 Tax=Candidatus Devosia phytovorans TaxID=3121372 RepID=A0AAJ5VTT7_9HYPH|nr:heme exporter protein CcmD [Devosia sp.]WEK04227.1 MAG: heme exporter protein CcmD [Devosia sp.]